MSASGSTCVVVIPCYNEAARLDVEAFSEFVARQDFVRLLFVDDGSRDATRAVLARLVEINPDRIRAYHLATNLGKAEAVRHGLLEAAREQPTYVGFWDADLATPLEDIIAFTRLLDERPDIEMVFGARVNLLGRSVHRRLARHYIGRAFATAAAATLGVGIYDTQCGAKLFRLTDRFVHHLRDPFIGGWIFDVELIAREAKARREASLPPVSKIIYEYPLQTWRDVAGSKIRWIDWLKVAVNLGRIYLRYR
jgi:glycosyltransferase involved in cell wall biosynthesis